MAFRNPITRLSQLIADKITGATIDGGTITGTTINGTTMTGGTINGTTINGTTVTGGTITGATITGSLIQTAASGLRWQLSDKPAPDNPTGPGGLEGFTGDAHEQSPGAVRVQPQVATNPAQLELDGPVLNDGTNFSQGPASLWLQAFLPDRADGLNSAGNTAALNGQNIQLNADFDVSASGNTFTAWGDLVCKGNLRLPLNTAVNGITAAVGWSVVTQSFHGYGPLQQFQATFQRTGATIAGTATGSISNTLVGTLGSLRLPIVAVPLTSGSNGPLAGFVANPNGQVLVCSLGPNVSIPNGSQISVGGCYLTA